MQRDTEDTHNKSLFENSTSIPRFEPCTYRGLKGSVKREGAYIRKILNVSQRKLLILKLNLVCSKHSLLGLNTKTEMDAITS